MHPKTKDLKSANHHWWPRALSKEWGDADGKVGRVDLKGVDRRIPTAKVGGLRNAHQIKLASTKGELSVWDENFEHQYDWVDSSIPSLMEKLRAVPFPEKFDMPRRERFDLIQFDDERDALLGLIVSLVVRSPKNREASVGLAEKLRGPIPEPERSALIGSNLKGSFKLIFDAFKGRGKVAFLQARDSEFVFGDGFPNDLTCVVNSPHSAEIFVPILPEIAVIFFCPTQYSLNGRYYAASLEPAEVEGLNKAVQVYAGKELFYRTKKPELSSDFLEGRYLQYGGGGNAIRKIAHSIPGVPDRDASFDGFFS